MNLRILSLSLCLLPVLGGLSQAGNAESGKKRTEKPALMLKAALETREFRAGDEIKTDLEIVNVSGKPITLKFMKPWTVVPEVWESATGKRLSNAPSYVLDQIVVPTEVTLPPQGTLPLWTMPVFLQTNSKSEAPGTAHQRSFWITTPGKYQLRHTVLLKDCLPGKSGELFANKLEITILSPEPASASRGPSAQKTDSK